MGISGPNFLVNSTHGLINRAPFLIAYSFPLIGTPASPWGAGLEMADQVAATAQTNVSGNEALAFGEIATSCLLT